MHTFVVEYSKDQKKVATVYVTAHNQLAAKYQAHRAIRPGLVFDEVEATQL